MYVKKGGKLVKVTKKSIGAVSPSVLKAKRDAFERKKKTAAFKRWRAYQYRVKQKGLCYYCRRPIVGVWVTDHIIPLFRGGTSAYTNLCVTCWRCNERKGIKLVTARKSRVQHSPSSRAVRSSPLRKKVSARKNYSPPARTIPSTALSV